MTQFSTICRAFISHSTDDDSYVAEIESLLRALDVDEVFNDVHAIKPDEKFWPAIEKGCNGLMIPDTSRGILQCH